MAWYNKLIGGGVKEVADGVGSVATSAGNLANRLRSAITGKADPETVAELTKLAEEADAIRDASQNALNLVEAKSSNIFIAGWRPAIGWVCALALFTYYIPRFIIVTYVWVKQSFILLDQSILANTINTFVMPSPPEMAIGDIIGLVMSLLGMAGMRSYEKNKGVAR